jgi:hypothetical protein
MNSLYKCLVALVFASITLSSSAQDLVNKIPSDALAVATIKGKNFTDLMSLKEFNNTFIGKEILSKLSKGTDKVVNSVENLGFDLSSSLYYYNLSNDSVSYNCFLAPVKNAEQLEALYVQANQKFTVKNGIKSYYNSDSTEVAHWNDKFLLFVIGSGKSSYFARPEVVERFKLSQATSGGQAADSLSIAVPVQDEIAVDSTMAVDSLEEVMADAIGYDYGNTFFKDEQKKKTVVAGWVQLMVDDFFTGPNTTSILNNKDFVKSIDEQAEATIWIAGADKLFNTYMPSTYLKGMSFLNGYGSANAKLFLEDKSIRISTSMAFSDEIAGVFKKVLKRKLNKRFLKYINEDKAIGYLAYAMDTKAYLEQYPKLMSKIYGSVYADEIGMAADLFSLLLDEEAISKVVKGDGLFLFNGLSQKEVSYKSMDYNEENFESKEVTKTKKETLPDFLFMMSSEDTRLIDKLIAYGVKKELVKNSSGYYELSVPKSPLALYFMIKEGIIFFGNNKKDMEDIAGNRYVANVSRKHRKALMNTNYAGYFSAKKLFGKIPVEEFASTKKLEKLNNVLNSMGDIYLKSNPIKGNVYSGEISMDIPSNQQNALKYLFSLVEDAQK